MARIAGVDIPREKRVEVALTYVFGVGRTRAQQTLSNTGIDPNTRVKDLSDDQLQLRTHIEGTYKVEGDLRREVPPIFAARSKSEATRACDTVAACPSVDSGLRRTLGPARDPSAPSQGRKRPKA
jgi:ribosomal protein S13